MQYRQADDMTWDITDDRAVVLDAGGATLITLNPVGTLLWQLLDEPTEPDALTHLLTGRFPEIPEQQLRDDVAAFLDELVGEGLVVEHVPST